MGTSLKGYVPDIPAPVPLGYPIRDMGYGQISRLVPDEDATSQKRGFTGSMSEEEDRTAPAKACAVGRYLPRAPARP